MMRAELTSEDGDVQQCCEDLVASRFDVLGSLPECSSGRLHALFAISSARVKPASSASTSARVWGDCSIYGCGPARLRSSFMAGSVNSLSLSKSSA
jgi:hypothetical protein